MVIFFLIYLKDISSYKYNQISVKLNTDTRRLRIGIELYQVHFANSMEIDIFAVHPVLPEWRNGRRVGLKIQCPLKTCGFDSHLGHQTGIFEKTERFRFFIALID